MGEEAGYGVGLSYWLAKLHWLAGRYDNPTPLTGFIPQSGTKNWASEDKRRHK